MDQNLINELFLEIKELKERVEKLEGKKKQKAFSKPEIYELQRYFLDRGSNTCIDDAERFYDFYESKNWFVGKTKMKCWKAAVRNWIRGNNNAKSFGNTATLTNLGDTDF